ncbi:hypothetical protein BN8_01561 [Fibrisoma limi BUZ 3]|uniref:DNA mimic protein DMP19 C-terminal domain-containing protein n=1 Tax=Fibrisoma limi BUZ 3 TaxID=1185876 RepID=I2GF77_9BACT|nr:DUF4375 domain-containing protein [Fibrisoma limi]CCH52552.1 hypothetical protein BN8_01561 [Fibrisoma limi BUZ 3]
MKNALLLHLILFCSQVCLGQSASSTNNTTPAGITRAMLDKAPDTEIERLVMDAISGQVNKDLAREIDVLKTLSKGQQAVYITWVLENEVGNGGFFQFFRNTPDQFAALAVDGIRTLGATPFDDILQQASEIYAEMVAEQEIINPAALQLLGKANNNDPMREIDEDFNATNEEKSLSEYRVKYIKSHKDEFVSK